MVILDLIFLFIRRVRNIFSCIYVLKLIWYYRGMDVRLNEFLENFGMLDDRGERSLEEGWIFMYYMVISYNLY